MKVEGNKDGGKDHASWNDGLSLQDLERKSLING
jgi:hypothetical protein